MTSRFANFIWENAAKNASLVIDLHENVKPALQFSIVGQSDEPDTNNKAQSLAEAFGLTIARPSTEEFGIIGMRPGDMGYFQYCMSKGVPAFMPELESSTNIEFNENYGAVRTGVRGVMNCLKKLGMVAGEVEPQAETKVLPGNFEFYTTLLPNKGGIVHRLAEVGIKLEKETEVANIVNSYGDIVETLRMPVEGYVFGWNLGAPPYYNWGVQSGDGVAYIYH